MDTKKIYVCDWCEKIFTSCSGKRKHVIMHHPESSGLDEYELARQQSRIQKNWRRKSSAARMMRTGMFVPPSSPIPSDDLTLNDKDNKTEPSATAYDPVSPAPPELGPPRISISQMDVLRNFVLENPSKDYRSHQSTIEKLLDRKFEIDEFGKVAFALSFLNHHLERLPKEQPPTTPVVPLEISDLPPLGYSPGDSTNVDEFEQYLPEGCGVISFPDPFGWADLP